MSEKLKFQVCTCQRQSAWTRSSKFVHGLDRCVGGTDTPIPGLVDLSEVAAGTDGVTRIVLESMQELLLKLAVQMAQDDYETRRERQPQGVELARAAGKYQGRRADEAMHASIRALRAGGHSIAETARLAGCSPSQVKRVMALQRTASEPGAA